MKHISFIWDLLQGKRIKLISIIGIQFFYVVLLLISPLLFSFLIDNVINLDTITNPVFAKFADLLGGVPFIRENLWIGAVVVIVLNIFICILVFFRGKWNAEVAETTVEKLRNRLYYHLSLLPYSYHVQAKTGDLIQRCTSDVDQIRRILAGQFAELFYAIFTAGLAVFILFGIYTPLAWLAVISMPFIFAFALLFFVKMQRAFKKSDEAEGSMSDTIQENLAATRVVKAFNREAYEIEKFEKKNRIFKDDTFHVIKLLGMYWGISDFICLSQILLIVIAGIFYARTGEISIGNFFVFVSYEGMILWPVRNIGRILSDMGKVSVSVGRLKEILDVPVENVEEGKTPKIKGNIVFDHVSFKYDDGDEDVLKDVSFAIEKGQTIAIMGPTGSGKSSLVHLLTRLYGYKGSIKLDGTELNEIQRKHLRKNVGIVLQEPFLFSKTILDNIKLSNPKASSMDVKRAAEMASVHTVIEEFERGYQTLVGEKGVTLSGGQKQRIAIARTIVNRSPILIFDDSLSAVDTQTDASIREAIQSLSKNVTTLIITHRVSSAQNADQIIVLENGKIAQRGKHEELIQQDGLYKRINEIQNAIVKEVV